MTPQQAGSLGGKMTFALYGADHMRRIGRAGARRFHALYRVFPLATSQWGIFERATGQLVAVIGTLPGARIIGGEGGDPE